MIGPGVESIGDVPILGVWRDLGGAQPKHGRAPAFWRGSKDPNVAIDGERGIWHDHAHGEGGGILALVEAALGCEKRGAVEWLESRGYIARRDLTPEQQEDARKIRKETAQEMPAALLWRRAILDMIDELLTTLKAGLFDPMSPSPESGEILALERLGASIRERENASLVALYRSWRDSHPHVAEAMIWSARRREIADKLALQRFLGAF